MSGIAFDHVGLSVADLDRQSRFYVQAFGFVETHRAEIPEADVRIALLTSPGGAAVEFTERARSAPQHFADPMEGAGIQGYFHWALTVDDLGAVISEAVAQGARVVTQPAAARRPGIRFAYVADPEGNLVELIQHTSP
ncbi:MAG: VOC family protein [Catenulispora sp.]|nr:VOC family protein [Catenulispora sp.]